MIRCMKVRRIQSRRYSSLDPDTVSGLTVEVAMISIGDFARQAIQAAGEEYCRSDRTKNRNLVKGRSLDYDLICN